MNIDISQSYKTTRLKYLLLIPTEKRMKSQIEEICDLTFDMKFLDPYRGDDRLPQICAKLFLESFVPEETLFEQDDEGDALYLILDGRIGVYEKRIQEEIVTDVLLIELGPGETIGELSLLYGDKRSATAVALEQTDLIVLRKDNFDEIIKGNTQQQMVNIVDFLQYVEPLHGVKDTILKRLATRCEIKIFGTYNTIIRQGETVSKVYFIKKGKVKVLKKIDFRKPKGSKGNTFEDLIRDPTEDDYFKRQTETKIIEINELGVGDVFGEVAVFTSTPSDCTIVTSMTTEVLTVDKSEFLRIDKATIFQFISYAKAYPADIEYRKNFFRTRKWEDYKASLVENIMVDKTLKKGHMKGQFRSRTPQKPVHTASFSVRDKELYGKPQMHKKLPPISNIYTMVNPRLKDFVELDPFDFLIDKSKRDGI